MANPEKVAKTVGDVVRSVWGYCNPPPRLKVSEWAEQHRMLSPEASAEHGKWRNSRAPHLVAPMDSLSPHDVCQRVVCMFASQTGKTEILLNFIGYIIDQDPSPTLAIQPTQKPMGEAFSKDRVAPMIRDTPVLTQKVSESKGRVSGNTMLHKTFSGGQLTIGGANSPAGLASRPIRFLLGDELSRWEVTKEGSALSLAEKRTRTFRNRKILLVSSPTFEDMGIHAEYHACDQISELHLRCPDCGEYQLPALKHFIWDKDPMNFTYNCEHCGVSHPKEMEDRIKSHPKWVDVTKDGTEGGKSKGFMMNQWASPFASWGETVDEFVKAAHDPSKLQAVVNTAFCETWSEGGEGIYSGDLYARREEYGIPDACLVLVCAVDVQADRLELECIGYGEDEQSWGLDYRVIWGDPLQRGVWKTLDKYLLETRTADDGRTMRIAATGIDSGHLAKQVYDFCKNKFHRRVFALKGADGWGRPIVSAASEKKYGRNPRPVKLFVVGVDEVKRIVHGRLKITEVGGGYCHFPMSYPEEFFNQLGAEEIRVRHVRGMQVNYWHQTRARNEGLDLRAYGVATLALLNPVWSALKVRKEEPEEPEEAAVETDDESEVIPTKRKQQKPSRQRSGFVNRWK